MSDRDFLRPGTIRYQPTTAIGQAFAQHSEDAATAARSGTGPIPLPTADEHIIYADPNDDPDLADPAKAWICRTCELPLSRLYTDNEYTWLHIRSHVEHDHEPDPIQVPRNRQHRGDCDFCSHYGEITWVYQGNEIMIGTAMPGEPIRGYGARWSACDECAAIIDRDVLTNRDFTALHRRAIRNSTIAEAIKDDPRAAEAVKKMNFETWGKLFEGEPIRLYTGPPSRLDPRHVDKYRRDLLTFWNHPELYDRMVAPGHKAISVPGFCVAHEHTDQLIATSRPGHPLSHDIFDRFRHHITTGITAVTGEAGGQYWVSKQFTHIANLAAKDFKTLLITRDQLPAKFGFVVYENPIGDVNRPEGVAGIRAFSWTLIPGGVWLNIYFQTDDGDPYAIANNTRTEWGTFMSPGTGLGFHFDDELHVGNTEEEEHAASFIRTIFATWLLLTQPGVAEQTTAPIDTKKARKYLRENGHKQPDVILVDLRRRPRRPTTGTTENSKRGPLEYRRYTRGHWKRQFFGPKRGQRKLIYISPYIAGPEDAPLRPTTPTIKVLR